MTLLSKASRGEEREESLMIVQRSRPLAGFFAPHAAEERAGSLAVGMPMAILQGQEQSEVDGSGAPETPWQPSFVAPKAAACPSVGSIEKP